MHSYKGIIARFNRKNILVIGDLILDRYIKGSVSRISPEAPVPVVLEKETFFTLGGSGNVAHNLSRLGAKVSQVGRIGDDQEGEILRKELLKKGINIRGVFVDKNIPTVTKTRIIADHQQVVRIDKERINGEKNHLFEQRVFDFIKKTIGSYDAIIISDYGKGLISSSLVNHVCSLASNKGKIITVDPKVEHFGYYRKVTAITPNLRETENAVRNIKITSKWADRLKINFDKIETDTHINLAGEELLKYLELESLLITLGEHGMRLFEKGKKPVHISTRAQEVFDVTGAGDTVISVFTLSLTAGATKRQAADLANFAAGIVVGKMGVVAVTKSELLEATRGHC